MSVFPMNDKRLKILSKSEINELYSIPKFSENERASYFSLSKKEYAMMSECGSLASKVHFILQLGYFKAASQFFRFTFSETKYDVQYILQKYFENEKLKVDSVSKDTRQTNQNLIATILNFETAKSIIFEKLKKFLYAKVRLSSNPIYLFYGVLCYCSENKLMLLAYSTMQKLIGPTITQEENRLGEELKKYLQHSDSKSITSTLLKDNNQYILSALKKDPKSFKQKQIKAEIKKILDHESLYQIAKRAVEKLNIPNQNIAYYASLAEHYPISDLKKLNQTKQAIYVLCYAHHRHQKINDNLNMSFSHYVEKFKSEASANARDKIFAEKLEINDDTKNAAIVFRFFDDEKISDNESFGSIRKRAKKYVKKGQFNIIKNN